MIYRDVYAEINLRAIENNFTKIRRHIQPTAKFCAVVKANAYGHGAVEVSKIAVKCGADFLAVATVEEGLELRKENFQIPILVLGLIPHAAAKISVENNLTLTVADFELAEKISDAAVEKNILAKVHLKIETGMGRIGIFPDDAVLLAEKISKLPNVELEGIFSHFADADSLDKNFTIEQLKIFKEVCEKISARGINIKIRHIAESAAILEIPEAHLDMVRSGIISYGLYPSEDVKKNILLQPAMKLIARSVFLKKIPAGTSINLLRKKILSSRLCRLVTQTVIFVLIKIFSSKLMEDLFPLPEEFAWINLWLTLHKFPTQKLATNLFYSAAKQFLSTMRQNI